VVFSIRESGRPRGSRATEERTSHFWLHLSPYLASVICMTELAYIEFDYTGYDRVVVE
jgi:hypothetical protein